MKIVQPRSAVSVSALVFLALLLFFLAPCAPALAAGASGKILNAVPRIEWALSQNQSGLYAFTFGEGIHEFRFDPVNAEKMKHLEFDLYLPDPAVINHWKTGETELEITSSGTCDKNEYAWSGFDLWKEAAANGLTIRKGWNHVRLNLPEHSGADLSRINYIRWYWNEEGSNRTASGCRVANLKFSVPGGTDPANAHPKPFIPFTVFQTEDVPVALADVTQDPYFADPFGEKDATDAIQNALWDVGLQGGGTVWMPAGKYRITGPIQVPAYVTLRGDWTDPSSSPGYGTVLILDIQEEDRNDTGTFMLGGCGGVYGLTVLYPRQALDDVKAYPFTFYTDGRSGNGYLMSSVINCTVLNGYRGIGATTVPFDAPEETGHENMYVINFRGTFLSCGAEVYNESDFGFWDDVRIGPQYWVDAASAGLLPPVDKSALVRYTRANASGLILGDLEWVLLNSVTVDSCLTGIHTVHGKRAEVEFQGLLYGITTRNCGRGLVADALYIDNGMVLAGSDIEGGLYNTTKTVVRTFNVKVNGAEMGRRRDDADFSLNLPIPDADFRYRKPRATLYTADLDGSGAVDVSSDLQSLLDQAGVMGGVVYLPAGVYRLDTPIRVPAGVELKGSSAIPTRDFAAGDPYRGTTLLSYYIGSGPGDQALITLAGNGSGLNGIRINYPENRARPGTDKKELLVTSYAVKGTAPNVYIVNSYIIGSAYGVDFTGCDHHCVRNLSGFSYKNTLRVGGEGGIVGNCFQNPGMCFLSSTPYVFLRRSRNEIYGTLGRRYSDNLIVENASGEVIYNFASLASHNSLTNINSTDTLVINLGSDFMGGTQTVMNGGSLTVVNAMRWDGKSFEHSKGILRLYNRFEHGYSSGLNGDAIEETYVAEK